MPERRIRQWALEVRQQARQSVKRKTPAMGITYARPIFLSAPQSMLETRPGVRLGKDGQPTHDNDTARFSGIGVDGDRCLSGRCFVGRTDRTQGFPFRIPSME